MNFGYRLREARENLSMTQTDLATKIGVTKSAISNYEKGTSSPKEEVFLNFNIDKHI